MRKLHHHPCLSYLDEMATWLREHEYGPVMRGRCDIESINTHKASWRRIVGQAGAVEALNNGERRKIWKILRDPTGQITPQHLFVNIGLTGGQISLYYEILRSNYTHTIRACASLAKQAMNSMSVEAYPTLRRTCGSLHQ